MKKKVLTLDDLYSFFEQRNQTTVFSAKESGYNIAVQVPAKFELEDSDEDDGFLRTKFKVNHLYENRNKSYISEEAQLEALPSLHYRPVLAAITTLSDGTTDFTSHAMEFDDEGNITYIEQPIGVFVNPEGYHLEYDKEHDKTYVIADAVIYNDYCAPACEIIQRKQGSKVSCELSISELSFDTKDKVLHLDKFRYNGVTCLGTDPITEKPVEEGMEGARLDIADFSEENNSLFTNTEEKLLKVIQSLQETLAKFEIEEPTKGGNQTLKLNELLEKYSKTVEDLDFDYESMSDEELEKMFSEKFEKEPDDPDQDPEPKSNPDEKGEPDEPEKNPNDEPKKYTKQFELSHEDIQCALYELLKPLEDALNEWYWIVNVYDNYFIYSGYGCKFYKQKYTKIGDVVTLDGERLEVFSEFLTEEELNELNNMRKNYSLVTEKLAAYEEAESIADKMTVFNDEAYTSYLETEEFKSLMEKETVKKFTKEELAEKADAALGKLVKENKTFSMKFQQKEEKRPSFLAFAKTSEKVQSSNLTPFPALTICFKAFSYCFAVAWSTCWILSFKYFSTACFNSKCWFVTVTRFISAPSKICDCSLLPSFFSCSIKSIYRFSPRAFARFR